MLRLLNQRCTVKRHMTVEDDYRTPIGDEWQEIAKYPCRLSRKNIQVVQESPENRTIEVYMLYLPPIADIQPGDLIEVHGVGKYRASVPYRPGNHHTEVQIEWEGEA